MPASGSANTVSTGKRRGLLWDILTFDRLMTGPLVHLVYWAGLALVALGGFTVVGAAVGIALRSGTLEGFLLAVPVLVVGLLVIVASALLWRGACEYYLATLRIAEDLREIRSAMARGALPQAPAPSSGIDLKP